ncbi:MAG: LptF/LptG family permease [Candidatus Omnitrophica bacterium]|nr:LptF/LptG family permease [Candidatus Omnitrophota bacterium]
MRILDRYTTKQLVPVWVWCMLVFVFISIIIDLFGHLEEILQYHIPPQTVVQYYLNFTPLVVIRASPLALLLSCAFVTMRLVRYQELLAMHASGISAARASVPFVFVGWLISVGVFVINDRVVPQTAAAYEQLRYELFRGRQQPNVIESVATLDSDNRLYHAREFHLDRNELIDLVILEHDERNLPVKSFYARQAFVTPHGLLLVYGTIYHMGPQGALAGEPIPFVERLLKVPVTPASFRQPETQPETMRFGPLRRLIIHLKKSHMTNIRRYATELTAKLTFPFMNIMMALMAFVGSAQRHGRGPLRGLGTSLGWGVLYYLGTAVGQSIAKEGFLPVVVAMWTPHLIALWLCWRLLR